MPRNNFPLPVKAVMIDLDGTLLDTVRDLAAAVNLMLDKLGRAPLDESLVRTFVGKGIPDLVKRSLAGALNGEPDATLFERALPLYLDCYETMNGKHTTLYPGVREGLDALKNAGFPLACVTNKAGRFTLPLLRQMRIDAYFAIVIAGDTLPQKKPDPLPLTHACRHFGIAPREMLMIGDSLNDAQAARAAGCPVFCVTYGYNEGADVRDLDIDAIVETLFEAIKLITKS
ncbi:MAG: phosphoglycolate phosphatase [Betaproteobacteria bacterium]|nr:phosphoglycolate phosphatase [Betaproteobacteria bacterium]